MLAKLRKTKNERADHGFTIIEVMIVLAIAGLILLIVLLAVPALQRSSRNTQRKNDAAAAAAGVANYIANNGGGVPDNIAGPTAAGLVTFKCATGGVNGSKCDATDPNTEQARVGFFSSTTVNTAPTAASVAANDKQLMYVPGWDCNSSNTGLNAASSRSAALLYKVETGTTTTADECVEQ